MGVVEKDQDLQVFVFDRCIAVDLMLYNVEQVEKNVQNLGKH